MTTVRLAGLTTQPLASYLGGLGVLRLVSEQVDEEARGWWPDDCFHLASRLSEGELLEFFLTKYAPTPVIGPWNGGSGFYPKDRKVGIDAIVASQDPRFEEYRTAIAIGRDLVGSGNDGSQAEDERRVGILLECRNRLPDSAVDWLDAAVGIGSDGKRAFAPILGTGGNEGRLDYTNNFMENLAKLLLTPGKKTPVRALLEHALLGKPTSGLENLAVGQYDPGRAGGFNQGTDIESGAVVNPWTTVLVMEGAVAWASGIYRRQGLSYRSILCSPFTVRPSAVGYASAAEKENKDAARAEVWTPLWGRPARYAEVRAMLREGRAVVGGKPARSGLEFAEAAASLGVDRGISGFMRYSLAKRRGDSYVALPTGRFGVSYRSQSDLARQVDGVLEQIEARLRTEKKEAPASWVSLKRRLQEAVFQVLLREQPGERVRALAAALGAVHRWALERYGLLFLLKNPPLTKDWLALCGFEGEGGSEVRIAGALAGLRGGAAGSILYNLDRTSNQFSWRGRDLSERLLETLRRRVIAGEDAQRAVRSPLYSPMLAEPWDVTRFLNGELDESLIEDLMFAFVLADSGGVRASPMEHSPWPAYALLKLIFLPHPVRLAEGNEVSLAPQPAIPALLRAGRTMEAVRLAQQRLRIAGFAPPGGEFETGLDARRLGAALLIPVGNVRSFLALVTEPGAETTRRSA